MKYRALILGALLIIGILLPDFVLAGEPTGAIGPMNPTMFRCVNENDPTEILIDRLAIEPSKTIVDNDATTADSRCTSIGISDFGFDTHDAVLFRGHLSDLERECSREENGILVPVEDTRIEGYVYEFHPDVNNPGEWFSVPSRDVKVSTKGITFEVFWGSGDDGYYYYPNGFGAGPIVINLDLPRDAHPINPNVIINSTGLEETWTVFMGFYRGDVPPADVTVLRTPGGNALPFSTLADIETLSQCGYQDLPRVAKSLLPELEPPSTISPTVEMPNVGGTLPQVTPTSLIILAITLVIGLPAAGAITLWRKKQP
jgi:hypothetical protein